MNKRRVNDWLAPAADALVLTGIARDGKINSSFRSQISSFGAAVAMGSLKAAAAFLVKQGSAANHRELLLTAMHYVVTGEGNSPGEVFKYICDHDDVQTRDAYIDAAIALKQVMNLYTLIKEDDENAESESAVQ